ncbi:MAG: putative toxin-antitoxin system toxin component, PIN family [Oscillospiraceae bacterium]|jgi:putative PIN family toxin of toxin-antitoxin system|nr:putative toxin-antitoxin system toxin component, PIN family [Oscillospiraceae bacterium]
MRILLDTNILLSAAYSPNSTPHIAYKKAVDPPFQGLICEQSIEELRRVFNRKFKGKIHGFERFVTTMLAVVEVIPVPDEEYPEEAEIRDVDDRAILSAAIKAGADILLTGDKDFLESSITHPTIMTAAQFVQLS